MSKRYLFFVGTLGNGGAERVISILSSQMAERGMDVEVLTYYDRPMFYKVNPKVKITAVETFAEFEGENLAVVKLQIYYGLENILKKMPK